MSIQKGTVLIHDGTKLIGLAPPASGNPALVIDLSTSNGVKWKTLDQSFKIPLVGTSTVSSTTYTVAAEFSFIKVEHETINSVKVVSKMDNGITSYDIRIFDSTNSATLAEINLTNTNMQINTIDSLSNIPTADAMIEVQARQTGGSGNKQVTIKEIQINYN